MSDPCVNCRNDCDCGCPIYATAAKAGVQGRFPPVEEEDEEDDEDDD